MKKETFNITALLTLIFGALFIIFAALFMISYTAGSPFDFGGVLHYLYVMGGLTMICLIGLSIGMIFVKNNRQCVCKVFAWGIVLFAVLYCSQLFGNFIQLPNVPFDAAIAVFAEYVPSLVAAVVAVSLIAQWDSSRRSATNKISLIGLIVSAAFTVYLIVSMLTNMVTLESIAVYSLVYKFSLAIGMTLFALLAFMVTRTRRAFDKAVFAMTDEEAEFIERIEDKVEEIADEMEQMTDIEEREGDEDDAEIDVTFVAEDPMDDAMKEAAKQAEENEETGDIEMETEAEEAVEGSEDEKND